MLHEIQYIEYPSMYLSIDEYNLPVSGVSIRDATGRSITVTWEVYTLP